MRSDETLIERLEAEPVGTYLIFSRGAVWVKSLDHIWSRVGIYPGYKMSCTDLSRSMERGTGTWALH